jgi:hypothetical protein
MEVDRREDVTDFNADDVVQVLKCDDGIDDNLVDGGFLDWR